jgi:hypothetical protein
MKNFTNVTSAPHAVPVHTGSRVAPTSTCAARADHTAIAMWSKRLTLAPVAAAAVKANRNKGAMGAPGFWDPV